jgi:SAM-dependent methyltransferase
MSVDETKLAQFMDTAVNDLAAAISGVMVYLGDELGLYRAMAKAGPLTSAEVAGRAGCDERYVREWLGNQAAAGYIEYDPATGRYELPAEQELALADDTSPVFISGGYQGIVSACIDIEKFVEAFRTGRGVAWGDHDSRLFVGTERFFRPAYLHQLTSTWIPALDGVEARLQEGAKVADVGCGHGVSSIVLATAYPESTIVGIDPHEPSIAAARKAAAEAGVADRVQFEVATAKDFTETGFDLICFFDCLHDMGDPVGAARHARRALADGGTVVLVEPRAGDRVEDNLNPVSRAFYGFSTVMCTMASRAQEVGAALGAQAGEERLRRVLGEAGLSRVRRATETPFNIVLEAKP